MRICLKSTDSDRVIKTQRMNYTVKREREFVSKLSNPIKAKSN